MLFAIVQIWLQPRSDQQQLSGANIQALVNSEELLLELTKKLKPLSKSVLNLQLPDPAAKGIFGNSVQVGGRLEFQGSSSSPSWHLQDGENTTEVSKLSLWGSVFDNCQYFKDAKFYNIKGQFTDSDQSHYETDVGFDALAAMKQGGFVSLHAEVEIGWSRNPTAADSSQWTITRWKLKQFSAVDSEQPYFKDVLPNLVDQGDVLQKATQSKHQQLTSRLVKGGDYFLPAGVKYQFFFPDVTLEHPGVSVVDIDQDGLEDVFVAMQHDSNLLFRNQGDGTFEESSQAVGLNIEGDCTCALFADFDNDGDPDVFIGRGRQPSKYMINQDGRFVESTKSMDMPLPGLVSSISAADFNSDGLLDVYISTYSPIESEYVSNGTPAWVDLFLNRQQAKEYFDRKIGSHNFLARTGPPNLLLVNKGNGEFSVADSNQTLELFKMTFQASWHDFDDDGDPDLYVANDYHRDNFFRNDGKDGFTDITEEVGLAEMGFGMGVSFGDYDNDGQTDIYVSNMFSKAGQRILSQVEGVDVRFKEMAKGNFLYRKQGQKYQLVSGLEAPAMQVAKAGWSWGGQFADFDNDSFRDVYVVNGYYTAPDDIAADVDL